MGFHMYTRIITVVGTGLVLASVAGPAHAEAVPVPEPGTLSMFAVGIAGAFVARKLLGRKKK